MVPNRKRLEHAMIVCHCFAISDARIRALIDDRATVREVMSRCGAGRDCGSCRAAIEAMLSQHGVGAGRALGPGAAR